MPTLRTDGAVIAYSDTGAPPNRPDAPTIVFGHGLLFSGWMFSDQIEALRTSYRCVAVDWRGQGASPPAEDGRYDMDTLYEDAVALIERLDVAPVHWVGLSMGGFVGQRVAARRPELLRSLTLLDTSADPEGWYPSIEDTVLTVIYRFVGIAPVKHLVLRKMLSATTRKDPAKRPVIDEWVRQLQQANRTGLTGAILAVANRKPVMAELGGVSASTLVICGADDVPTPVAKSRRIAAAIAGARLEIVPGAGHSSSIEAPEEITALIEKFVGEVDAH